MSFQEFQVIPEIDDFTLSLPAVSLSNPPNGFAIALSLGKEFYRKLQKALEEKFGKENISLGDEAGFSAPFKNNEEAIEILAELISKNNYPLRIGLDAAATNFYVPAETLALPKPPAKRRLAKEGKDGVYKINDKKYSADELKKYYLNLVERYDILSIEDPFQENDFASFAKLTNSLQLAPQDPAMAGPTGQATDNKNKRLIITDDITTTNPKQLKKAIEEKSGNAILVKLNQIGILTETLKVVKMAYKNNWKAVVSHRSGETMDDFIADLAVGVGAWGIKAGAPAKPERLVKYERLLEIQNFIRN